MSLGKLRSWLFTIPLEWAVTAVMITIAVVTSVVAPAGRWQRFLYRLWGSMVLGIAGARVRVHHAERLDVNNNYVVAANHLSLMDTPLMLRSLPIEFKFLAKRELLRMPFIGWYLKRGGHLTVDRGSLRSSLESMNECARLIRERKLSVLIFPEGTRGLGELQPFKDGAAYLAIQSGVPVVPVAIRGTEDVLAAKSSEFRSASVDVIIGEPVPVAGMTLKDRGRLTAELHARVSEMLAESRAGRN
ncbi:MAG TPA: lysophospholipid acyltransferase family protein [Bryobacteraceae bacterium]|nr:lysophospholipid acyltransferase family protein [Bryobacteraceae bacterium]HPT26276.1 lysophospholipid acyltransferase family protein [Bryobacteraceae bacterium]